MCEESKLTVMTAMQQQSPPKANEIGFFVVSLLEN